MPAVSNTDYVTQTDRQAIGNQPDYSTPTGTEPTPVGPGGSGTITSIAAGIGIVATPDPIVATGTIALNDLTVNVRDYGATGDGVTNDTAAINAAIVALASYGTLYFPPGKYLVTLGTIQQVSGLTYITIRGSGWGSVLYSSTTGAPGNFLVIDGTCDHVSIECFAILGSATSRGSGIGIRLYAPQSSIFNVYVKGTSDFGIHVSNDQSTWSEGQQVVKCLVESTQGDGVHFGAVKDALCSSNTCISTGDDSFAAVADSATYYPIGITFIGNVAKDAGARGFAIIECYHFLVTGNTVYTSVLAGIEVNRYPGRTTAYNTYGKVTGNQLYSTCSSVGPLGAIGLYWVDTVECTENKVETPQTGSGIAFLDTQAVLIAYNFLTGCPDYGIRAHDLYGTNVAATWDDLSIKGNVIPTTTNYDAIYVKPIAGKTITNLKVCENETRAPAGNFIYYDQITTGQIRNNTSFGSTIAAGGTITAVTLANNS